MCVCVRVHVSAVCVCVRVHVSAVCVCWCLQSVCVCVPDSQNSLVSWSCSEEQNQVLGILQVLYEIKNIYISATWFYPQLTPNIFNCYLDYRSLCGIVIVTQTEDM